MESQAEEVKPLHPSDKPIKLNIRLYNLVCSILQSSNEPMTVVDLRNNARIVALGVAERQIHSAIKSLYRKGFITKIRVYKVESPSVRYAYEWTKNDAEVKPAVSMEKPAITAVGQIEPALSSPNVKVDLVKATGRLRIELSGITLEIGVI